MPIGLWGRLLREIALGALACAIAVAVLLPGLWLTDLAYRAGELALLSATLAVGALLILYQARLRPALREPVQRVASNLASALAPPTRSQPVNGSSPSAFRSWSGVPIPVLRAYFYGGLPPATSLDFFCAAICTYVRERASLTNALTWALREVGGSGVLLLHQPDPEGEPLAAPRAALQMEETYRHLWSAEGPAGHDRPAAFATVVRAVAHPGGEASLYEAAVELARAATALPAVSGAEVLLLIDDAAEPTRPASVLCLIVGVDRDSRRQVYRVIEAATALHEVAAAQRRYELLSCDAYVAPPVAGTAEMAR